MIKVGKRQKLKVNNIASIGLYLDAETGNEEDNILLPNNEFEEMEIKEGEILDVLIYCDSEDRLIATLKRTEGLVGQIQKLKVVDKIDIGAFMYWGLEKDLLLPIGQQETEVTIGKKYLVGIYEDQKGRPSATMRIYNFLLPSFGHEKNEFVTGTVYRIEPDIGVFVAVEDRYFGLIPNIEVFNKYSVGDELNDLRIIRVREDGKIDLSPRKLAHIQIVGDAKLIFNKMENENGELKIGDKSSPDLIKQTFNMSKKSFKRAIGNLLKDRLIEKDGEGFKIV